MQRNSILLTVAFCVGLLASGCAPYAYKKEIESFSNATKAFSAGVDEVRADLAAQPEKDAYWEAYEKADERTMLSPTRCLATNTKPTERCALRVAGETAELTALERQTIKQLATLKRFSNYASALSAVANAEDSDNFTAASAQLATNATAFIGIATGGAGALVGPVIQTALTLERLSLEQARLQQLRKSVAVVDTKMPAAGKGIANALTDLKKYRIEGVNGRMDAVEKVLRRSTDYTERAVLIREMQAGADEIARLQAQDPAKLVNAMVGAHAALAKALVSPRVELAVVVKEISAFADLAEAFKTASAAE